MPPTTTTTTHGRPKAVSTYRIGYYSALIIVLSFLANGSAGQAVRYGGDGAMNGSGPLMTEIPGASRQLMGGIPEEYRGLVRAYGKLLEKTTNAIEAGKSESMMNLISNEFADLAAVDYNVSEICMNRTLQTLDDLFSRQYYALQMFDALAKPPAGIMYINLKWMGSYEQCLNITSVNKPEPNDHGAQYCMTGIKGLGLLPAGLTGGAEMPLSLGLCVPDGCSDDDVTGLLNAALSLIPMKKPIYASEANCDRDTVSYTGGDVIALIFCAVFLLLAVLGTAYDYYDQCRQVRNVSADVSDDVTARDLGVTNSAEQLVAFDMNGDEKRRTARLHKFLLAFSVLKNANKLFDISNTRKDIQILHGLRAISMWWVILGHAHLFYAGDYDNLLYLFTEVLSRWTFQAVGNATFSVDTFFFLSGLLVTYLTLKYLRQNDGKLQWIMFYVHRYIRLTPVYAFCILIFSTLFYHLPRIPHLDEGFLATSRNMETCKSYWWANLLYINNFVPLNNGKMCFGWAWYLANDMQFYVISPYILILLYKWPRIGLSVIASLIVLCMAVTGFVSNYFGQFGLVIGLTPPAARNLYAAEGFDYIYGKPYTRINSYLVGVVTGYILHKTACQKSALKIHPILALLGWVLAWANALAVLYGFSNDISQHVQLSTDVLAFYTATSRFAWSLSLAWLTIACVHGYGGPIAKILEWKFWIPVSRLTYCAYLVHPIWFLYHAQTLSAPIHYTDISMIYVYIGGLVCAYSIATIVSLLVEAPLLAVEKIFLTK